MKIAIPLLSIFLAGVGLTVAHAADWSRYHFGLKTCIEAPEGTCGEEFRVCKGCDQQPKPEILRENLDFEAFVQASSSAKDKSTSCYRKRLSPSLSWISTATWVDRRSEIIVVDPSKNQVLLYTVTGQGTRFPAKLGEKSQVESTARASDSYILKLLGANGVVFDGNLEILEPSVNLKKSRSGADNGLGSLYDWTVSGGRLFAFGIVKGGAGAPKKYESGFFDAAIGGKPLTIEEVQLRVPYGYLEYYLLGHPYVAAVSNNGYFLKMDEAAKIFRVPAGYGTPELLNIMPSEIAKVPRIKSPALSPIDNKNLYEEITTYQIPVGIYGYQGMLYVLGRSPSGKKTLWWLYQIDPANEKVVAKLRLPITAEHVTVVPSPSFWFIFEKGAVGEDGTQDVKSLLAIPARWIVEATSSPLKNDVTCVSAEAARAATR